MVLICALWARANLDGKLLNLGGSNKLQLSSYLLTYLAVASLSAGSTAVHAYHVDRELLRCGAREGLMIWCTFLGPAALAYIPLVYAIAAFDVLIF